MEIYLTSKFKKSFRRLPKTIKERAKEKEKIFRENPLDPRLETHSLHGKYKDFLAFSIDNSWRIMFQFLDSTKKKVAFINVGTHEIYK